MFRRLLAVFLALWLPLQVGTAFAISVPMQASSGGEFSHAAAMAMAHAKVDTTKVDTLHASHASDVSHVSHVSHVSDDCADQASDCHAMPAHDPATCLKCAFCFASAAAFIGMPGLVSVLVVNTAPASTIAATFDSVALIPPDPPPIA